MWYSHDHDLQGSKHFTVTRSIEEQKSWQVVIVYGSIVGVWYRHREGTDPFAIEIEQFQQPVSQPGGRRGIDDSSSSGR